MALGRAASHASISDSRQRTARAPIFSGSGKDTSRILRYMLLHEYPGKGYDFAKAQETTGGCCRHGCTLQTLLLWRVHRGFRLFRVNNSA